MQKSRRFLPHAANIEKWHYQTHLASRNELPKAFLSLTKGEGEKLDGGATVECVWGGERAVQAFTIPGNAESVQTNGQRC